MKAGSGLVVVRVVSAPPLVQELSPLQVRRVLLGLGVARAVPPVECERFLEFEKDDGANA